MPKHDLIRRFLFEGLGIRGQWVKLTESWQTARALQKCPVIAQNQLGQALAAVALLSSTIKFKGSLILQTQGTGAIKTLVAQATHDRKIRGLVRWDDIEISGNNLFSDGQLILTINTEGGHPYQGIVPLQADNLASAIETYFVQSEQLDTRLWLVADTDQAVGLLVQALPNQLNDTEHWQRVEMLADTITNAELLELDCDTLLYRLFNEEQVRLFEPELISFACSCSRSKIETMLRLMGRPELESILAEQGQIEVNCEFCNCNYHFDKIDTENLLHVQQNLSGDSQTRH